jgi:hypothetical protein
MVNLCIYNASNEVNLHTIKCELSCIHVFPFSFRFSFEESENVRLHMHTIDVHRRPS